MKDAIWVLDPTHSEIGFKVKHLMISNIRGNFTVYEGGIFGEDLTTSPVKVKIEADSILTQVADRDTHLKSADFFDVETYKYITFEASSFTKISDSDYKLKGELTIKGVSKPVELDVDYGGVNTDPWGNQKMAMEITGSINRKDWGLNWNAALETGGVLVGDTIKLTAEVQFAKQV